MSTAQKNGEPTTLVFIRVVAAVVVIVTLPAPWNAPVVLAAKLVWLTSSLVWVSHRHSKHEIAGPDRLLSPRSAVFEPFLTALLFRLVGSVSAVVLSVAFPACGDAAAGVLAAELVHATRHLGCNKHDG